MTLSIGHCRSNLRSTGGLTLVEILITVSILGAVAVGILPGLAVSSRAAQVLERQAQAYFFCLSKMSQAALALTQGQLPEEEASGVLRVGVNRAEWLLRADLIESEPLLRRMTLDLSWMRGREIETFRVRLVARLPDGT
jgi:hypothetical protein